MLLGHRLSSVLSLWLSCLGVAQAATWVVAKDGSGDFADLQTAADHAASGDVLVVRDGVYDGVVISYKSLTIVGAGAGRTIVTSAAPPFDSGAIVPIVDSTHTIHVASLTARAERPIGMAAGTMVIDDLTAEPTSGSTALGMGVWPWSEPTSLVFAQRFAPVRGSSFATSQSMIYGQNVAVFSLTQSNVWGHDGTPADGAGHVGTGGQSAFALDNSPALLGHVSIAHCSFTGGRGGDGGYDSVHCYPFAAGRGGDAMTFKHGRALVIGAATDLYRGGDGGNGKNSPSCQDTSAGGDGGNGVADMQDSSIEYAKVRLAGGHGGVGNPPGADGAPTIGNVTAIAPLPTSRISGSAALGATFAIELNGSPGDRVLLLVAGRVGFVPRTGAEGFPLFAVPGSFFLALPLGVLDDQGNKVLSIIVPSDPSARGGTAFFQALMTAPAGEHRPQLTNVSFVIVKEP